MEAEENVDPRDIRCQYRNTRWTYTPEASGEVLRASRTARAEFRIRMCVLDEAQFCALRHELTALIDQEKDSLRFYNLGNKYAGKTQHVGAKPSYEAEGTLML